MPGTSKKGGGLKTKSTMMMKASPEKKEAAKAKAVAGGMPQNVADKVFKMKSPEVAYMAKVAGNPAMEMDKVMYQDPEVKKTQVIGGQPRPVRQKFDTYTDEIRSYKHKHTGERMAVNYLGGKGNRAEEIPTREAVGGGKQTSANYAIMKGMVKDSLSLVNRGQGFKAQQLYGQRLGGDFKQYGDNPKGLQSLVSEQMVKLKRSGVTDGNYSGQRPPAKGPHPSHYGGGYMVKDAPYLKKNPHLVDKKASAPNSPTSRFSLGYPTKYYSDRGHAGRANREDAKGAIKRAHKRARNVYEQN